MKQGSEEWLELRRTKIGASDAPVIAGVVKWKTIKQLWEEKLGLKTDDTKTWYMQRGNELEPVARDLFTKVTGIPVEPEVVFHPKYDWMMASLDGLSDDKSISVEIKCPGEADHATAKAGRVPDKYYPQVQHQLEVLGHDKLYYFSFLNEEDYALVEVMRDDSYIEVLRAQEETFWDCVQNFVEPTGSRPAFVRKDEFWTVLSNEWKEVQGELARLKDREAELREKIVEHCNEDVTMGNGIKVQRLQRKGSIKYKDIPELKGVDLEKYRGETIDTWKITLETES